MKVLLGAAVVVGALAIGGIPALAFTIAADESGAGSQVNTTDEKPGIGPPPWANSSHHRHGDRSDKTKDKVKHDRDGGRPDKDGKGKPEKDLAGKHMSLRHHHGMAMRHWAHCVADKPATSPGDSFDPERACGKLPLPPGQPHKRR